MANYGFAIDLRKCIGCHACTVACKSEHQIPLGQRLFDNVFLWLIAGILVMAVVYTGWGLYEILTLPPATLP